MPTTIFISAGEASGEHYGALLIAALKKQLAAVGASASFFGMGGERMAAEGLECVVRSEEMAVMGLTEVVRHLPRIWREFRKLKQAIRERQPSVAMLIDFPEIHFRLAKQLHRMGVPVIFFVSPQLWAWKKKRIRLVQKYIDKMLVIFPFEEAFYRQRGIEAEFVGHPLAELPLPAISRAEFAAAIGLDPAKTWIGLLPGSRPKEIRDHLPTMLLAARGLASLKGTGLKGTGLNGMGLKGTGLKGMGLKGMGLKGMGFSPYVNQEESMRALAPEGKAYRTSQYAYQTPEKTLSAAKAPAHCDSSMYGLKPVPFMAGDLEFIVPLAPTLNEVQRDEVRRLVAAHGAGLTLRLVEDARAALMHARASVVASGTATVEAALIGNPFVVVYRVSALTYAIAKRVVKVPHVAMVNLIAGKRIVPELIQSDFTAANIVQQIAPLLADGPQRQSMMEELARIRGLLVRQSEGGASDRVAAVTLETIGFEVSQV
ncbi:MAG: lipid-A-disaccharide synthase [Terracidiphilus sp.]